MITPLPIENHPLKAAVGPQINSWPRLLKYF